ncbi:MAG: 4'-phosphopantetheinyl transferase superfamily protein [Boseongicola sp.]|nr:4'-phosphopantetheinyl transferase superfamily protein [Boseongicola sp.]
MNVTEQLRPAGGSCGRRWHDAARKANGLSWRLFHTANGATVVHVDLVPNRHREVQALAWLDSAERERRARFLHPRPQRQFTLCRAVLRQILCRRLGCRNDELSFATGQHGKPFALARGRPAPVTFNVSHGGRHGLIAFASAGQVGVDVEERLARRDMDGDIRVLFAPRERSRFEALSGSRKTELYYRLWTLKEALVKATGIGLQGGSVLTLREFERSA